MSDRCCGEPVLVFGGLTVAIYLIWKLRHG